MKARVWKEGRRWFAACPCGWEPSTIGCTTWAEAVRLATFLADRHRAVR